MPVNHCAILLSLVAGCAAPVPIGIYETEQTTVIYAERDSGPLLMDVAWPNNGGSNRPAVLWIHGGAYLTGDRNYMAGMMRFTASMGYVSASMDYRLVTTGATLADAYADAHDAYVFLVEHAHDFGIDPTCISVAGDSAGAHLALLVGLKEPGVRSIVDIYGPTDLVRLYEDVEGTWVAGAMLIFMQGTPDQNPATWTEFSPVANVTASSPPVLILHGTADGVVPFSQATALRDKLDSLGCQYVFVSIPDAGHGWVINPLSNDNLNTAPIIVHFLDSLPKRAENPWFSNHGQ